MKKWLAIFLSLSVLFGLSACGEDRTAVQNSKEQSASEASVPATENETEESDYIPVEQSGSRILIAYFTWAENTQVENPDGVDVDATTSASVLLPGCSCSKFLSKIFIISVKNFSSYRSLFYVL